VNQTSRPSARRAGRSATRSMGLACAVLAAFGLAAGPTSASFRPNPVDAEAGQATSCPDGSPRVRFSSDAEMRVPVGGGSAIPPAIQVTCNGGVISNPRVIVTLAPRSAQVAFGNVNPAPNHAFRSHGTTLAFTGDEHGEIILPILTSNALRDGRFTLTAAWDGVGAILSGEVVGSLSGILPPRNPRLALGSPDDWKAPDCSGPEDVSAACLDSAVSLIELGRRSEQLGPLVLPSNWGRLSVAEQLFVLTDLERTARGLPPVTGLARDWDTVAQRGAAVGRDPRGEGSVSRYRTSSGPQYDGSGTTGYWSVETAGGSNSIVATYEWVYTDGIFADGSSGDSDCNASSPRRCWGHRDALLNDSDLWSCQLRHGRRVQPH
jgi:hypothetical protein